MDAYIKQLEVTELTALQVMQSSRSTYNPYEWKKAINLYLSIDNNARFFTTKGRIYDEDIYVIYLNNGIRFMQELSYCTSLSNQGFYFGELLSSTIFITQGKGQQLQDNASNRDLFKKQCAAYKSFFYTKETF